MSKQDRWADRVNLWAVPLLMTVVAVNQLRMAGMQNLSPWKGGGFGMFATIDSPASRAIKCRAFDERGKGINAQLSVLDSTSTGLIRKLTVVPGTSDLEHLAGFLVNQRFVMTEARSNAIVEKLKDRNPNLNLPVLHPDQPYYRPEVESDAEFESDQVVDVSEVQLEMMRLRWDSSTAEVWCEALEQPVHAHAWDARAKAGKTQ